MMNRSLVTKKSFRLPKALEKLFDNPPLVGNERREDYDAFCLEIEIALGPTDFILLMLIREFADISWELQRERWIKAGIIALKQQEARCQLGIGMTRADFERQKLENANPSAFTKRDSKPKDSDDEPKSWLPEAYALGHREIDIIDTRIASYMFRRNALLREIERYSESLARKLDRAAPDIIEGEFSEPAE
jgi:hypothetical protein